MIDALNKNLFVVLMWIFIVPSVFAQDLDPKDVKVLLEDAFPVAIQKAKNEFPDIDQHVLYSVTPRILEGDPKGIHWQFLWQEKAFPHNKWIKVRVYMKDGGVEMERFEKGTFQKQMTETKEEVKKIAFEKCVETMNLNILAEEGISDAEPITIGIDIPDFCQRGDSIWEIRINKIPQELRAIAWVNPKNKKVKFIFTPNIQQTEDIPMGKLGYQMGTYLTIEGIRMEKGKVGTRTLLVDTVNGKGLLSPIPIWIDNVKNPGLPKDTWCVFQGYESGKMIGLPFDVAEKEALPVPQAVWQLFRYFVVTSVVEPKDLKSSPEVAKLNYSHYESIFKEYRDVVEPVVKKMDPTEIERLTDIFINKYKNHAIAEIYIWNTDLKTENNLLFKKTYVRANTSSGTIAYPKRKYADPRAINIHELKEEGQSYILIEQQFAADEKISYRIVIFLRGWSL